MAEDPLNGRAPTDLLIAELEGALAAARDQQALLRSSLTTVIAFLDRDPGP